MTTESWTRTPEYTIAGIGPYQITHPYAPGAIRAQVMTPSGLLTLVGTEFSVTPTEAEINGDLFLSPTAAATHAGRQLIIDRVTPDEQGWLGVTGEREKGLEAQLDRMVQANQELRALILGAVRIRGELDAFDWEDGTVPLLDGTRVISGPSAAAIAAAEANALAAAVSASAAAASAAEALAKENSMLRARQNWATATAYAPSDIVRENGNLYLCLVAHTSGTFATDLGAGRWFLWLEKGAAGAGAGDMLKTENLLGLTDYPLALSRLGGQTSNAKLTSVSALALAAGDLVYGVNATTFGRLAIGADGKRLGIVAALPAWVDTIDFSSSENNLANNTTFTFAHGLGAVPRDFRAYLRCATAVNGYSVGHHVLLTPWQDSTTNGVGLWADETNVYVRIATVALMGPSGYVALTAGSSWKLFIRAWK